MTLLRLGAEAAMRYAIGFIFVLTLGVMPLVGCSETMGTEGSGGSGGDGGSAGSGGGTVTLSVFPFEILSEGEIQPLGGVQLCATDRTNCTITDDAGSAALDLPVDREISYAMEKQGYQSDEFGVHPIAGATFEILGTTGESFYVDDDGSGSSDLSATTSQGAGGFVEVSPGEYELQISGEVTNCEVLRGWPSDSEDTMRVPVREGYHTITRWYCPD